MMTICGLGENLHNSEQSVILPENKDHFNESFTRTESDVDCLESNQLPTESSQKKNYQLNDQRESSTHDIDTSSTLSKLFCPQEGVQEVTNQSNTTTENTKNSHMQFVDPSKTYASLHAKVYDDSPWSSIKVNWPCVSSVEKYVVTIEGNEDNTQRVVTKQCECLFEGLIPAKEYCIKVNAESSEGTTNHFPHLYCKTAFPLGQNRYQYMTTFADNEIVKRPPGLTPIYRKVLKKEAFAVKRILKTTLKQEVEILSALNTHENVIQYKGYDEDEVFVYLHLERCSISLDEMIEENHPELENKVERMRQIANGLYFLHKKSNIFHRDLKPSNILFNKNVMKISDFSISKQADGDTTTGSSKGSDGYMPYELVRQLRKGEHRQYTDKCDIFALGVVFHYIQTGGENPFDSEDCYPEFNIACRMEPVFPEEHFQKDGLCESLLTKMLSHDHAKRPSIDQVLSHPLFWNDNSKIEFIVALSGFFPPKLIDKYKNGELSKDDIRAQMMAELEEKSNLILSSHHEKWVDAIPDPALRLNMSRCDRLIISLIRYLRNQLVHIEKIKNDLRRVADGSKKHDVLKYFENCFPTLVAVTYDVAKKMEDEESLKRFYKFKTEL